MYTRLRDAVPDTHIHTHTLDLVVRSVVRLLSPGSETHPAQTMGGPVERYSTRSHSRAEPEEAALLCSQDVMAV